jgi:hypothetical protein
LLFLALLCFALTWISKRSESLFSFVGSLLGFDDGGEVLRARDLQDPERYVDAGRNCCDGGGGGVYSPFPRFRDRSMIWLYGVLHGDEKAEMCRLCIEQKFPFCAARLNHLCIVWDGIFCVVGVFDVICVLLVSMRVVIAEP